MRGSPTATHFKSAGACSQTFQLAGTARLSFHDLPERGFAAGRGRVLARGALCVVGTQPQLRQRGWRFELHLPGVTALTGRIADLQRFRLAHPPSKNGTEASLQFRRILAFFHRFRKLGERCHRHGTFLAIGQAIHHRPEQPTIPLRRQAPEHGGRSPRRNSRNRISGTGCDCLRDRRAERWRQRQRALDKLQRRLDCLLRGWRGQDLQPRPEVEGLVSKLGLNAPMIRGNRALRHRRGMQTGSARQGRRPTASPDKEAVASTLRLATPSGLLGAAYSLEAGLALTPPIPNPRALRRPPPAG